MGAKLYVAFLLFSFWKESWLFKVKGWEFLVNKNINFNKNKSESKMENATHSFREINVVFQLIWKSQIKSTTVMSWGSRKNRRAFFAPPIRLFCQKKMFLKFVFYFNIYIYNIYISYIYNKYIYIYILYIYIIYILYIYYIYYIYYILLGIHFMQGWTATTRRVTRKRSTERLRHTGNLFRKNLQLKDVC